jgi:hypothetical protein
MLKSVRYNQRLQEKKLTWSNDLRITWNFSGVSSHLKVWLKPSYTNFNRTKKHICYCVCSCHLTCTL